MNATDREHELSRIYAIPWLLRGDAELWSRTFPADKDFPGAYVDWLETSVALHHAMEHSGAHVERVVVYPNEYFAWAEIEGHEAGKRASLHRFAKELVVETFSGTDASWRRIWRESEDRDCPENAQ